MAALFPACPSVNGRDESPSKAAQAPAFSLMNTTISVIQHILIIQGKLWVFCQAFERAQRADP